MKVSDVYCVSDDLVHYGDADFENAEHQLARLGVELPVSYKQLLVDFGSGAFCSDLRLMSPNEVAADVEEWRSNAAEYHFYEEEAPNEIDPKRLAASVYVGHTTGGDSLVWLPDSSSEFALIPEGMDHLVSVGTDLGEAIEEICTGSNFNGQSPFVYFEPRNHPQEIIATCLKRGDASEAIMDSVLRLGVHDRWYTSLDETVSYIFVKSFGGQLCFMRMELHEPDDASSTGGEMRSGGKRYETPPEFQQFIDGMTAGGGDSSCSDLSSLPPMEDWTQLPDIPLSAFVSIRFDHGKENTDLERILATLSDLGMKCGAPSRCI